MALSVYVHIPYCLQRCRYCDFTTFEQSAMPPPDQYVAMVLDEIRLRRALWPHAEIATLYFGGGTPSLIAPELIVTIKRELANAGFTYSRGAEITIEINPATLTGASLDVYRTAGINRFSVGAQTFNDSLLALCGRRHTADDTRATLKLLAGENHSFDLLFALPGQSIADLERDLNEVGEFSPPHLSAYCLTVPEGHPMAAGRGPEGEQVAMFDLIEARLREFGLARYEISNFSRPGFESRHNLAYWRDRDYWGLGLSAHSYGRGFGPSGTRFWNPKRLDQYSEQARRPPGASWTDTLPSNQFEVLQSHEALTDFCHIFLRTEDGLPEDALRQKFALSAVEIALARLWRLNRDGMVETSQSRWRLTRRGRLLCNKALEELTFLPHDLESGGLTWPSAAPYCSPYE